MAAPEGNNYWTRRKKHGRGLKFETPEILWEKCVEYFEWIEANPLVENRPFAFQGVVTDHPVEKMRAMTLEGLCLYIGTTRETWSDYRTKGNGYSDIVREVEDIIREQKFTGAAADLLNPTIIARDLGLRDNHNHEMTGKDGGAIETKDVSEVDRIRRLAFLLSSGVIKVEKQDATHKEGPED